MGSGVSPERPSTVEAELVPVNEGSMHTVARRDGAAPPGSWAASRTECHLRNPGGPTGAVGLVTDGGAARGATGARCRAEVGSRIDS